MYYCLEHNDIVGVLNDNALRSIPEQVLYEAIIFWIMHNQSERSHLAEFLKSNAMKHCPIDVKLDMHAILSRKIFDANETHQIWEARYDRLAEKYREVTNESSSKDYRIKGLNDEIDRRILHRY